MARSALTQSGGRKPFRLSVRQPISWCLVALAVAVLLSAPATASVLSYTGAFTDPNDVFEATFTLAAPESVLIQTYGFGGSGNAPGGTNGAGQVIAPGGFDPYLSLFAGTGPGATFLFSNDDGVCAPGFGATDGGRCFDSTLNLASLGPGSYTLALTQPSNFSFAENYGLGTLGDGFIGLAGDFTDVDGIVRTGAYAVDIVLVPSSPLTTMPEPGTLALLVPALAVLHCVRRRMSAQS